MIAEIKSGKETLDEFFKDIKADKKLNQATTGAIVDLYKKGKLSDKNLTNALAILREGNQSGKDK